MNTRFLKRVTLLALLAMSSGCATTAGKTQGNPILSAEQAQAMIRVEVRVLEPLPIEHTLADVQ